MSKTAFHKNKLCGDKFFHHLLNLLCTSQTLKDPEVEGPLPYKNIFSPVGITKKVCKSQALRGQLHWLDKSAVATGERGERENGDQCEEK